MSLPQMEKQPMTVRPFPLIRASKAGFQEDERQFTYHPTCKLLT